MAADDEVARVLRAMAILEGRVRAATALEIGRLTGLDPLVLARTLSRAVVGGWMVRLVVRADAERAGVRAGTTVYRLTDMARHRIRADHPLLTSS